MAKPNLVIALKHQLRGWLGPNGRNRALTVPLANLVNDERLHWLIEVIIKAQEYGGATVSPQVWALEPNAEVSRAGGFAWGVEEPEERGAQITCHAHTLTGPIIYSDGLVLCSNEPVTIKAVCWLGVWHLGIDNPALDDIFPKLLHAFDDYDRNKTETRPDGPANA